MLTGNWGNDLTLLVKAAREAGFDGTFYTFYGNALGAPAAIGDAGIGKVLAVADWFPNVPTAASAAFYKSFRERFPNPADDYVHMRMQLMVEALAQATERAGRSGTVSAASIARELEKADVTLAGPRLRMRAADHQGAGALELQALAFQACRLMWRAQVMVFGSCARWQPPLLSNPTAVTWHAPDRR